MPNRGWVCKQEKDRLKTNLLRKWTLLYKVLGNILLTSTRHKFQNQQARLSIAVRRLWFTAWPFENRKMVPRHAVRMCRGEYFLQFSPSWHLNSSRQEHTEKSILMVIMPMNNCFSCTKKERKELGDRFWALHCICTSSGHGGGDLRRWQSERPGNQLYSYPTRSHHEGPLLACR